MPNLTPKKCLRILVIQTFGKQALIENVTIQGGKLAQEKVFISASEVR